MPAWNEIGNIWKNIREVDLRPIRAEAEQPTEIAIVGGGGSDKDALVEALRTDPRRPLPPTDASTSRPGPLSVNPNEAASADGADLIALVLDASKTDDSKEREVFWRWIGMGKKLVILYNKGDAAHDARALDTSRWQGAPVLWGSTQDTQFLENQFVPAVLELLPDRHLSLARYYPLFRVRAARQLIAETSRSNASYSFSSGIAEIIPVLDIPFNVADMLILTKTQALMAYRLGLMLGLSPRWQDHMAAFGSTIGSGFILRQVARGLVGLIPLWGIIPKVAIAYAGTYALGHAILQWYVTGRQITPEMMRGYYKEALTQGKSFARALADRAPRRKRKNPELPAQTRVQCSNCGHMNPAEFKYCGNCGRELVVKSSP